MKLQKLAGFASPYMLGLVAGVAIVSTTMANKAALKNEQYQQQYLELKQQNITKLNNSLKAVYATDSTASGTVTQAKLNQYLYTNIFDVNSSIVTNQVGGTAGEKITLIGQNTNLYTQNKLSSATAGNILNQDLTNTNSVIFNEKNFRENQIRQSYINMQAQAQDIYKEVIDSKSYIFTCSITNTKSDAWGRNFTYKFNSIHNAELSFNLPWNTSVNKVLPIKLPIFESSEEISKIINNNSNSFILTSYGNVYSAGRIVGASNNFVKLNIDSIKDIYEFNGATYLVAKNGNVWATGANSQGQLGIGNTVTDDTLLTKTSLVNINKIYGHKDGSYAFALSNNGDLYATGSNSSYELGLGDDTNRSVWTKVNGVNNIKDVYLVVSTSIVLDAENKLWATGVNPLRLAGVSGSLTSWTNTISDVGKIYKNYSSFITFIQKNNGQIWETGSLPGSVTSWRLSSQFNDTGLNKYLGTSLLNYAIDGNGDLWVEGSNSNGQLGLGDTSERTSWTKVSAFSNVKDIVLSGTHSAYVVLENGKIYVTGDNSNGQLGLSSGITSQLSWVEITDVTTIQGVYPNNNDTVFILASDGSLYVTGKNANGVAGVGVASDTNIFDWTNTGLNVSLINVKSDTVFVSNSTELYSSGKSTYGIQGTNNDSTDIITFTQTLTDSYFIITCS
jgi:alpha-tubulin suppressor-like RCC1 family protein